MLYKSLMKLADDFKLFEEESFGAEDEALVIKKLDKSVKFDEIDTITFGLETDDGKIVKVYVNVEQADDFEKALATKLGEIDDIEEVLNELAKEYEIIDVEWPEEEIQTNPEEAEDTGKGILDPSVYGYKVNRDETQTESLSYGENLTMSLLEDSSTISSRFTSSAQLMIYHAILDLGIPEISLARNPYKAAIIKGIKDKAEEVQKNPALKNALKMFIRGNIDFDKKAAENESKPIQEIKESNWLPSPGDFVTARGYQGLGWVHSIHNGKARLFFSDHPTRAEVLIHDLKFRSEFGIEDLEKQIKELKKEWADCDDFVTTRHNIKDQIDKKENQLKQIKNIKGIKEDMKTKINEEIVKWNFSNVKGNIVIDCDSLSISIDSEETEKLIKGINNHSIVVVKDETVDPVKKVVFSPRGSSILVKEVGVADGYLMNQKDVEDLLVVAAPARKLDDSEEVTESEKMKVGDKQVVKDDEPKRDLTLSIDCGVAGPFKAFDILTDYLDKMNIYWDCDIGYRKNKAVSEITFINLKPSEKIKIETELKKIKEVRSYKFK